ncbi:MAG: DUF4245 domain-containing protein [Micromonosporaceae bacterium]
MIGRAFGRRAGSLIVAALACLLFAAAMIVMTPRPVTQIAVAVSYSTDLAKFKRVAPHIVLAPEGLPAGWRPVSSRLTVTGGGVVSWHLGFITPSGRMASLEESNERPAEFIRRMTNNGDLLTPVWSAGAWWARRLRPDKDQRSMYRSAPGAFTLVVTGTSGWEELAQLAGSLRPQP